MPGILIEGCGSIGRRHARNLSSLWAGPIFAFDPDKQSASGASKELGIEVLSNLPECYRRKPDAVLICSPPVFHLEAAQRAVGNGCHVFVEKPVSHDLRGIRMLRDEVDRKKLTFMIGYNWVYHPNFVAMRELLRSGAIGDVQGAMVNCGQYLPDWHPAEDYRRGYSARRELGGGVLLDSHELAYIQWLLGKVELVFGSSRKISDLEIDTDDTADLVLRLVSGAQVLVHLDYLQQPKRRSYEIYGSRGTIIWDLDRGLSFSRGSSWERVETPVDYEINDMYIDEMKDFLQAIAGGSKPEMDIAAGISVLSLIVEASSRERTAACTQVR